MMRRLVWVAVAATVVFVVVTVWALESEDVVVLRTRAGDGAIAETRVWVADGDGFAWIEAATPERGWYRELQADPSVELVRGGATTAYEATGLPGPDGHARIRGMLRAKYGWADVWVGLLQDTSQSIAVRLAPAGVTLHE